MLEAPRAGMGEQSNKRGYLQQQHNSCTALAAVLNVTFYRMERNDDQGSTCISAFVKKKMYNAFSPTFLQYCIYLLFFLTVDYR